MATLNVKVTNTLFNSVRELNINLATELHYLYFTDDSLSLVILVEETNRIHVPAITNFKRK